jgi:hypothetical protein
MEGSRAGEGGKNRRLGEKGGWLVWVKKGKRERKSKQIWGNYAVGAGAG